jgi:signal transduction histidine kinase
MRPPPPPRRRPLLFLALTLSGLLSPGAALLRGQETPPATPAPAPADAEELDTARPAPASVITTIRELRDLASGEAAEPRLVRVTGVITYYEPARSLAFIQDETGGAYFISGYNTSRPRTRHTLPLRTGDEVELTGLSGLGGYAPYVGRYADERLPRARVLGRAPLPSPLRLEPGRLLDPSLDARWVEAIVNVREVRRYDRRLLLQVANGVDEFSILLPGQWTEESVPADLHGSTIRVRGVYGSITDANRRLVAARLYTPSLEHVEVLDQGSRRSFETPPLAVDQILQFRGGANARVHVRGVVTGSFPGRHLFLRSDGSPLAVSTRAQQLPHPGSEIAVVGFPVLVGDTVALHTPDFRVGPRGPAPAPVDIAPADLARGRVHGELVRTEARILDTFVSGRECTLLFADGGPPFSARLTLAEGESAPSLPHESWVRITGIAFPDQPPITPAAAATSLPAAIRGASILLRDADDLRLLRAPPFWTRARILAATAATLAGFLLVVIWAALLRRKVRQQTALIAAKIEREKVADERARIARELHDTVEQELAGIGLQLDLALARVANAPARARAALDLALRMLRRTQVETRRSIQDLRSDLLERTDLATALAEAAREFRDEKHAPVHDRVDQPASPLAALAEQHLLRIAREALANAARHARASRIDLVLENTPGGLRLVVSDDGVGFDPAQPHPGHFGLQGMRERSLKIGARFALETRPGAGSRVTVDLPVP